MIHSTPFQRSLPYSRRQRPAQKPPLIIADIKAPTSVPRTNKYIDSISTKSMKNRPLPLDFEPGPFDIICNQGKYAKIHAGNVYFENIVKKWAKEYANANKRTHKSKIVSEIIQVIESKSPNAGFLRKIVDKAVKGRWRWEVVSIENAREKVSQRLRDARSDHFRSSLLAKRRSRQESNLKKIIDFGRIVASNQFVSTIVCRVSGIIQAYNAIDEYSSISDKQLLQLMTSMNIEVLQHLKQDQTIQSSFRPKLPTELFQMEEDEDECDVETLSSSCSTIDEILKRFEMDEGFVMIPPPETKRRKLSFESKDSCKSKC
mmetsp:Transcript_5280/g.15358  ORF Transcript_5280/g.15358 Transcript_5280/m.15358 type:complete len:317 (-) Transcript_5280:2321-3271(-)